MTTNPLQPLTLKDFIDRALSSCRLEEDRKCMQEALIDLIGETYDAGLINIHRWELQCVPNSKTMIKRALDTASYHEYPPLSTAVCHDIFPKVEASNKVRAEMFYQQRQKNVAVKPRRFIPNPHTKVNRKSHHRQNNNQVGISVSPQYSQQRNATA